MQFVYSLCEYQVVLSVNPFLPKGFPIDEWNRLALDRVKFISANRAGKG